MKVSKTILQVLLLCLFLTGRAITQQFDSGAEQQLVQAVNRERARAGLPSLKVDDRLTQAARAHSALMAKTKELSHEMSGEAKLSKRLAATGIRFNNDAENVAYDSTVEGAHSGLMHSPPHRENILSPKYNTLGIGVVRSGDLYWVTEDFANRLQEYSVDDAENAIIAEWEHERQRARLRPAPVARLPQLRRIACANAQRGKLDTRAPLSLPDVQSAVVYTESDPAKLAPSAVQMARDPGVKRFAAGACFAAGEKYPSGAWWVAMVFY